jgi:hypothetical protein
LFTAATVPTTTLVACARKSGEAAKAAQRARQEMCAVGRWGTYVDVAVAAVGQALHLAVAHAAAWLGDALDEALVAHGLRSASAEEGATGGASRARQRAARRVRGARGRDATHRDELLRVARRARGEPARQLRVR